MTAFYNEIDPEAAAMLRACIEDGVIAPGVVDTRSITEIEPHDLEGFTQVHFFAGGGLWSVAARLAGWPDHWPLWTGSCPCQPFSVAGKGRGVDDERHLWPHFHRLISASRPPVVVGEQVAGAAGYAWFDGVAADLEREAYAAEAVDIPACAVDAPHIRSRLYWTGLRRDRGVWWPRDMVDAASVGRREGRSEHEFWGGRSTPSVADASRDMGDGQRAGLEGHPRHVGRDGGRPGATGSVTASDGRERSLADGDRGRHSGRPEDQERGAGRRDAAERPADGKEPLGGPDSYGLEGPWLSGLPRFADLDARRSDGRNARTSFWHGAADLVCHDGKTRRAQPDIRLLAHGLPGRVGLWRVAGNAISPVLAAEALGALLDSEMIA